MRLLRLFAALVLLLAPFPVPALQSVVTSIDPDTESGTQLAIDLNASFLSLISQNRGNDRPAYAIPGTIWIDVVSGTQEIAYIYDGNSDIELFSFNPSTHTVSYALATGAPTGSILYRGASSWTYIAPGTTGRPLISQGTGAAPVYANLPVSAFNGGSGASASTYWRGDGTWASMAASSPVVSPRLIGAYIIACPAFNGDCNNANVNCSTGITSSLGRSCTTNANTTMLTHTDSVTFGVWKQMDTFPFDNGFASFYLFQRTE